MRNLYDESWVTIPLPAHPFGLTRCNRGRVQFTISIAAGVDSGDGRSGARPIHNHEDNWRTRLMRHLTGLFLEAGHLLLTAQFAKYALQFSAEKQRERRDRTRATLKRVYGGEMWWKKFLTAASYEVSTSIVAMPWGVHQLLLTELPDDDAKCKCTEQRLQAATEGWSSAWQLGH